MGAFGKSSSPPQPTNQFETPTANQTDAPTGQPAFQQPPSKEPQSQPKSGKNKFRVKTMQISAPPGLEGTNYCPQCQKSWETDVQFCGDCGVKLVFKNSMEEATEDPNGEWEECFAEDGSKYYFNRQTGESVWAEQN